MIQRSLVLIKPGAVKRNLMSEIIGRYETKGLKLVAMKFLLPERERVVEHYKEHEKRPFFGGLVSYLTSGPVVAMAWEGRKAIEIIRKINGATNPDDAKPGTIRGDFAVHIGRNVVHASDTVENGKKEVAIWFKKEEIVDYRKIEFECLYDAGELADEEKELAEKKE